MPTMHHPALADVREEVADDKVKEWTEAGWLKSEPKAVRESRQAASSE